MFSPSVFPKSVFPGPVFPPELFSLQQGGYALGKESSKFALESLSTVTILTEAAGNATYVSYQGD